MSWMRAVSWMRAGIVLGGVATAAGVAGMFVWIHDDSSYLGVAAALASAGVLTLVGCVLTRMFGSRQGSQEGRAPDVRHSADVAERRPPLTNPLAWSPDAHYPVDHYPEVEWDRVVAWMRVWRIPLVAGALSLALAGVVVVSAMALARPSVPAEALGLPSGSLLHGVVPLQGATPPLVRRPLGFGTSTAGVAGASLLASAKAGISVVVPMDANGAALLGSPPLGLYDDPAGASGVAVVALAPAAPVTAALATVAPAIPYQPAAAQPVTALRVEPIVASSVAPLTAAERTAADALAAANDTAANALAASNLTAANAAAAANLTAANALAAADLTTANALAAANVTAANAATAADLTAANAAAAADLTAATAAAAAAATAQAAADAAWAVANP